MTEINHFEMARQMARLMDAGLPADGIAIAMHHMFPTVTAADIERAERITDERYEILQEEQDATAQRLKDELFSGATSYQQVVDTLLNLKPSAETLFPKPDKSKS